MKKAMFLTFLLLCLAAGSWAQYTVTIGSGTGNTYYTPINAYYGYTYSQQIYLKSELDLPGEGLITKVRFYLVNGTPTNSSDWVIYLGHTSKYYFSSNTNWVPLASLTKVFEGQVNFPETGNWMEITLTTPFNYNNIDNLIIAIDENTPDFAPANVYWSAFSPGGNRAIYYYSDITNPNPASPPSGSRNSKISQVQFNIALNFPYLFASKDNLSFGYTDYGSSSAEQSYMIYAGNLSGGPIVITAPSAFAVSLVPGGPYSSVVNIAYTNGEFLNTPIYTVFIPDADNVMYSSQITNEASGLSQNLTVSGTSSLYPLYCASVPQVATGHDIVNVSIGSLDHNSNCSDLAPGVGSIQNMYSNFYFDLDPPDLQQSSFAYFSMKTGDCDGTSDYGYAAIYIDFNRDGDFTDDGEQVFNPQEVKAIPFTESGRFYIPSSTPLGHTMMRVVSNNYYYSTLYAPSCSHYLYQGGETEDYMVNIAPPPPCPPPVSLNAYQVEDVSANLMWTPMGSEAEWEYIYGLAPLPEPNNRGIKTNSNTINQVTGLIPDTTYQFYVRACCSPSEESQWSDPYTFTTRCGINGLPYSEGFESYYWPPDCWTTEQPGYFGWTQGGSGRNGSLCAQCSYQDAMLETPFITPTTDCQLKFWYKTAYEPQPVSFDVKIGDATIFQIIDAANTDYQVAIIPLSEYTGEKISISFVNKSSTYAICLVDDVVIEELPSCPYPISPVTVAASSTTAILDWTPYGIETTWEVIHGTPGFDPSTEGTLVTGITSHPYTLDPPFAPDTEYEWYVRAVCGDDDKSPWSDAASILTSCVANTSFPFQENFDGMILPPECWSTFKTGGPSSGIWQETTTEGNPRCYPHSGSYMTYYRSSSYNDGTTGALCSPPLDLTDESYILSFWMFRDRNNATQEHIDVYINTMPTLNGATLLKTIYRFYAFDPVVPYSQAWYRYSCDLPAGTAGNVYYILWDGYSDDGANMYLEDIAIFKPGGNIEGYVYDAQQNPINGARVMDALGQTVYTDVSGYYFIAESAQGSSEVTASQYGYCSQTYQVSVPAEGTVSASFILPAVLTVVTPEPSTVYLGYPPLSCATLGVEVSGGTPPYSYLWCTGETTPTIEVCPEYPAYCTVVITDAYACTPVTAWLNIDFVDVRCGNNQDKVVLCHYPSGNPENFETICVNTDDVPEHLAHGDQLGECPGVYKSANASRQDEPAGASQLYLDIIPNPSLGQAKICYGVDITGMISIDVVSLTGKNVKTLFKGNVPEASDQYIQNSLIDLPAGIYMCVLKHSDGRAVAKKLVILK